jgi:hypothetical protein
MRKYCKLAAAGQCDLSWSTSRCSSDILVLPIFAAAHFVPPFLLPSGYTAANLGRTRSTPSTNTRRQKLTVSKSMERYGHRSGAAVPVNSPGSTVLR